MKNKLNWLTKKKLFFISFLSTISFLIIIPRDFLYNICSINNRFCVGIVNYSIILLMIGVSIFFISIIMFFVKKEEIFELWKKTLFIYLFIYLFIAVVTPWYAGDGFLNIQKGVVLLLVSGCYLLFSLFFIIYKSLIIRKKEKNKK